MTTDVLSSSSLCVPHRGEKILQKSKLGKHTKGNGRTSTTHNKDRELSDHD